MKFPPEIMSFSWTPARNQAKLGHSYCVYPDLERKTLSTKPGPPVPPAFRLISPLKGAAAPGR